MGHRSGDGIVVLHVKRINHLFHCYQMIILPFFQKIHTLGSDPFSCLTSSCQQHPSTPLHTPLHPTIPVSTFYLKLSAAFKTTFLLFFPCRAEQLFSMARISHFLINCPLNHSTQTGLILTHSQWTQGSPLSPPTNPLPGSEPHGGRGFGLSAHTSPPSLSFSHLHFDDTLPAPWEGEHLGLCLA